MCFDFLTKFRLINISASGKGRKKWKKTQQQTKQKQKLNKCLVIVQFKPVSIVYGSHILYSLDQWVLGTISFMYFSFNTLQPAQCLNINLKITFVIILTAFLLVSLPCHKLLVLKCFMLLTLFHEYRHGLTNRKSVSRPC